MAVFAAMAGVLALGVAVAPCAWAKPSGSGWRNAAVMTNQTSLVVSCGPDACAANVPLGEWYETAPARVDRNGSSVDVAMRTPKCDGATYRGWLNGLLGRLKREFPEREVVLVPTMANTRSQGVNKLGLSPGDYAAVVREAGNVWAVTVAGRAERTAAKGADGWRGRRVAFLGDSITDRHHIGCTSNYWNFLERDLGLVPLVYGINGHEWRHVLAQATTLFAEHPKDVDAIVVFAGTNDYNANVPLGDWTDGAGSFRGRIAAAMNDLTAHYPETTIWLLTPLHRGYATFGARNVQPDERYANTAGLWLDSYVNVIKEAAAKWSGARLIDLNAESGLYPVFDSHTRYFHDANTDRLHPNTAGHERLAKVIARHLNAGESGRGGCLRPDGRSDAGALVMRAVRSAQGNGGGTVRLADGEYHFYSSSATNMRFHVSNHDQPAVRPVFLPFVGVTNVSVVAKNAKFVMHGMGTAILVRDSLGVSFRGITVEWEKPFFAKAEVVGYEQGKTRIRFPGRQQVGVKNGQLMLYGEDWEKALRGGNVFDRTTHEMIERTGDVGFNGVASDCGDGTFLIDMDLSGRGAGVKVGDVYVMRDGYRPHPVVCLDHAKDTVFEDFVFRDGFGMGLLAQLSENITLRGGGCYPRDRNEYSPNTVDATHFSNCRGTVTVENCRFEGMLDDALNVHSTSMGIVAKPSANSIRCRYMHPQSVGLGVFAPGDAVRFIAGRTLENGAIGRVKSVETHNEREITLTLEEPVPSGYAVGDAVENADWQCAVVFRNNTVANNRARAILFTTPRRIVCEGNFFDHVSGSAILLAGDAQGWYESGACEDVVIRKNRFRDCLTSSFQYCDGLVSIHPEVKDLAAQRRRYHRNVLIEDNDIETFNVPLLYALSAEDVVWRNNRVTKHDRYRGWGKPELIKVGCGRVEWK